jgi:hypothetical protein
MNQLSDQAIQQLKRRVETEPQSPLFARLAEHYLLTGVPEMALRLCDQGLAVHPFYTTAHIVKAKALLALKMPSEARREFEFVKNFLPVNPVIERLLKEVPPSAKIEGSVSSQPVSESPGMPTSTATPAGTIVRTIKPQKKTEQPPPAPEPATLATSTESDTDIFGLGATTEITTPAELPGMLPEQAPSVNDDTFGFPSDMTAAPTTLDPQAVPQSEDEKEEVFGDPFGMLHPETESAQIPQPVEPAQPEAVATDMWAFDSTFTATPPPTQEQPVQPEPTTVEPFEDFSARVKLELIGTENTVEFDEYIGKESSESAPQPESSAQQIEDLAGQLETAKRFTPIINLADQSVQTAKEEDTGDSMGFVTPTLAEIYAKQGWYDDAIRAYKSLIKSRPADRDKFENRIRELEQLRSKI